MTTCFHRRLFISNFVQKPPTDLREIFISNAQNVRLQRRHRPTDDASTRRWRGSQQANNDTFITSLATLCFSNN